MAFGMIAQVICTGHRVANRVSTSLFARTSALTCEGLAQVSSGEC